MVAQCADSSSATSSMENSSAIGIVIDDHQNQYVFSPNMMQLVSNLLLQAFDSGHFAIIEQFLCWHQQDPCDCAHTLSLLVNELRTTRHCSAAVALVRVVAQLLRMAPDPTCGKGLRTQMEALRFDELMLSLRDRFLHSFSGICASSVSASSFSDLLLEEAIDDCLMHMAKATAERHGEEEAATINSRTDADSGTFSGDEEETKQQHQQLIMLITQKGEEDEHKNVQQQQQQLLDEVIHLVHTLPAQELLLLAKLLHTNRPLGALISLIGHLDNYNCQPKTSSSCQSVIAKETRQQLPPPPPAPPPPPTLLSTASPSLSASCTFPPAPPPPPPAPLARLPPPPPPPLTSPTSCREPSSRPLPAASDIPSALRPKALPDQCRRLRHLQWTKLPTNAVAGATLAVATAAATCANVWQTMEAVDKEMRDRLDFAVLDAFFGCPSNTPQNMSSSDISHRSVPSSSTRRRSSMMLNGGGDCVALLDAKRSLSVNVFLKMCRDSGQLLNDLAEGKADKIGADRLRTISHLLPSTEEQKLLRDFSGDKHMLGAAEQFLLALIECIPAHRLRVEAMLFRLDLQAMLEMNRPTESGLGLKVWLKGCQELLGSSTLRKVLYALLHLGNYLNHGAGAGNAVGFRLSSLWKVEDVKTIGGTTRGRTLLHFVAQQVDNCAQELAVELQSVREAARSSLEAISDDVRSLSERMHCLEEGIARTKVASNNSAGGDNFLDEFLHFLEKSRHIIASAERQLTELGTLRRSVASFLCEQERSFSLEECFKVIAWFITRFEKAVEDNQRFMARDQQQQQQHLLEMGDQQLRKPSPDRLNAMALKSVTKKRDRQSIALVDERERQQTPHCLSSPGKVRRRRTAHSVTPLLDARPFLNGLEECVERTEVKDSSVIEQSLEAVVDQALMRREIVSARETKHTKKVDEEGGEEKRVGMKLQADNLAQDKMAQKPIMEEDRSARQQQKQHQQQTLVASNETKPLQKEVVRSSALATMSTNAKKHLIDRRSLLEHELEQGEKGDYRKMEKNGNLQQRVQTVTGRVGAQQFGTVSRSSSTQTTAIAITIKPNSSSRIPAVVRKTKKSATPVSASSKRNAEQSSASKCPPAVCRIRMVVKPSNNGQGGLVSDQQLSQRQAEQASDCPLKPSQVKASQPKVSGGVGSFGIRMAPAAFKSNRNMTTMFGPGGFAATAAKTKSIGGGAVSATPETATPTNRRSPTGGGTATVSQSSGTLAKVCGSVLIKSQHQQQKDKTVTAAQPQQQQQHGPTKPTLTRRLSTSSRPTLVHSVGRSGAGSRESKTIGEKPKWI